MRRYNRLYDGFSFVLVGGVGLMGGCWSEGHESGGMRVCVLEGGCGSEEVTG